MVNLGIQDGKNATANAYETMQYYALTRIDDERVEGVDFEQFLELKNQGLFEDWQETL